MKIGEKATPDGGTWPSLLGTLGLLALSGPVGTLVWDKVPPLSGCTVAVGSEGEGYAPDVYWLLPPTHPGKALVHMSDFHMLDEPFDPWREDAPRRIEERVASQSIGPVNVRLDPATIALVLRHARQHRIPMSRAVNELLAYGLSRIASSRSGGYKRWQGIGADARSASGRRAANARWAKHRDSKGADKEDKAVPEASKH
jgi:hypothetical protein